MISDKTQPTSKAHLLTKSFLLSEYVVNGKTQKEISCNVKCSQQLVGKYLAIHGIKSRSSGWVVGQKHKESSKIKISESQLGNKNHRWLGDDVGYRAVHTWVQSRKKKPHNCEHCNKETNNLDLANISGEYNRDLDNYIYLCRKCHMIQDGRIEIK